ncbi:MAG TPA: LytTR family DNA-binding domain-containing protein [Flavobacteriaceae bacterium]|nr:LytTR family DNA-binding domain-containing protein [Flavobacteriaceae bacterium]
MIKIVILDDEKHCTEILETLIGKMQRNYEILGVFNDPIKALSFINEYEIDLLFLDIQMPKMNGFKLLDRISPIEFDVIFTTAYDQYAIRAFEYSAFHYLLKPITEKSLVQCLLSWEQRKRKVNAEQWGLLRKAVDQETTSPSKIALPTGTGFEIMKVDEIVRCQSENNYTSFVFEDGTRTLVCRTLKDVERILPEEYFLRIHQSHLINAKFVKSINRQSGGTIFMVDGGEIPISRQKKNYIDKLLASMLKFD